MTNRSLVAAGLLSAALITAAGWMAPEAEAQRGRPRIISNGNSVSPRRLGSNGGQVTVTVTVRDATSATVTARATKPGSNGTYGPSSTLSLGSGNVYSGSVVIPANTANNAKPSKVVVTVTAQNGTATKNVGTVTVAKPTGGNTDDSLPPPPPRGF